MLLSSSTTPSGYVLRVRLVASLLLGFLLLAASAGARQPLKVGDVPPDSLGRTLSGQRVKLGDYQGKVVIVTFWATWCSPCRQELPVLAGIQKQVSREKLVVFAVNWKEKRERFREVVKRLKDVDLSLVSDEDGYFGSQYDVTSIPHMIIIGRDGRIAAIHVGYGEGEIPVLVKEINELLAAKPEPAAAHATADGGSP